MLRSAWTWSLLVALAVLFTPICFACSLRTNRRVCALPLNYSALPAENGYCEILIQTESTQHYCGLMTDAKLMVLYDGQNRTLNAIVTSQTYDPHSHHYSVKLHVRGEHVLAASSIRLPTSVRFEFEFAAWFSNGCNMSCRANDTAVTFTYDRAPTLRIELPSNDTVPLTVTVQSLDEAAVVNIHAADDDNFEGNEFSQIRPLNVYLDAVVTLPNQSSIGMTLVKNSSCTIGPKWCGKQRESNSKKNSVEMQLSFSYSQLRLAIIALLDRNNLSFSSYDAQVLATMKCRVRAQSGRRNVLTTSSEFSLAIVIPQQLLTAYYEKATSSAPAANNHKMLVTTFSIDFAGLPGITGRYISIESAMKTNNDIQVV